MVTTKSFKIHLMLLGIVIIVFVWSAIKPKTYFDWILEVSPATVVCFILVSTYRRIQLTTLSYSIIALLSILTFIGGHYTYSEVPLFNWIKEEYHLKRNHYDRFGHLFKGLSFIVVREILIRLSPLKKGAWLSGISLSIVLAVAALYEIIEALSTIISKNNKTSKDFLGMQGDKWDAQWDMALALLGSILAWILLTKLHDKFLRRVLSN